MRAAILLRFFVLLLVLGFSVSTGVAQTANPPNRQALPTIDVTSSRLGAGIVGASTTVITAEDIARSPGLTIQDLLSREPGLQTSSLFSAINGSQTNVDLRGFGAAASSNTLVLINGRRMNDWDIAGFDLSTIPRNSIERIEITRGNSGAVLYGDGAVGGVINIVTKSGFNMPPSARLEGATGSYRYAEGVFSVTGAKGPFAASVNGTAIYSDGYRSNNSLRQQGVVGDFRFQTGYGVGYLNIAGDNQNLGLPGARLVTLTSSELETDRRGTSTPYDYGAKQGMQITAGLTRTLGNLELIMDGGIRRKKQQAAFFNVFGDTYTDATLWTYSFTPRANLDHGLFGRPARAIFGFDGYYSDYRSDRSQDKGTPPVHRYGLTQKTLALYGLETVGVRPNLDFSFGGRLQRIGTTARDTLDPTAPGFFGEPQGIPFDNWEWQYAYHVGAEFRATDVLTLFGRTARSFRVANVDERISVAPFGTPNSFDLKTQTSHDVEGGAKLKIGRLNWQTSVYDMELVNELHFNPITFTNVNLDPTRRYGVESLATYQLTDSVRLKGGIGYTRSIFREGSNAGHDVPLVSRWTANIGGSWDIVGKALVFDGVVRYVGTRRMDNDQANFQPLIPAHTTVDLRLGGEQKNLFWSVSAQNIFNVLYFDYAIASTSTFGTYNAYPLAGATYLARLGVKFE